MFDPKLGFVLLFVENPVKSANFYRTLFQLEPIEVSPTFALFALTNGVMLGFWSRYTAEPAVTSLPGASEICFAVDNVDNVYNAWAMQGVTVIQKPTEMDFGRTFVALDPDGHRIRIYTLKEEV